LQIVDVGLVAPEGQLHETIDINALAEARETACAITGAGA
jgi:hypothetical protein